MKTITLESLFNIEYGTSLGLNHFKKTKLKGQDSVNFISRTSKNNGVSSFVKVVDSIKPIPANTITVSLGGSVLESFLQTEPYYTGFHIMYLSPKVKMTESELYFIVSASKRTNTNIAMEGKQIEL